MRADRVHAVVQACEQHGFLADMSGEHAALGDRGQRHAGGEVGAWRWTFGL
jgi:hypothetical protein